MALVIAFKSELPEFSAKYLQPIYFPKNTYPLGLQTNQSAYYTEAIQLISTNTFLGKV
jgi:hypothetical protein